MRFRQAEHSVYGMFSPRRGFPTQRNAGAYMRPVWGKKTVFTIFQTSPSFVTSVQKSGAEVFAPLLHIFFRLAIGLLQNMCRRALLSATAGGILYVV